MDDTDFCVCGEGGGGGDHHAAGALRHLVKLIYTADALVAEHQCSTLQHGFSGLWVLQATQ